MQTRAQKSAGKKGVTIHGQPLNHNLKPLSWDKPPESTRPFVVKMTLEQHTITKSAISLNVILFRLCLWIIHPKLDEILKAGVLSWPQM